MITRILSTLENTLMWAVDMLYSWVLLFLLIGVGLALTAYLKGVQFRHFKDMVRSLANSRTASRNGISSFQAFAVGIGTRIGIGNIGGVALALIMGGPGAIFWMWIVAAVGMASSFVESVLAQLFKVRHADGTFRGGPAYYLRQGLNCKPAAVVFAAITVLACGFAVPMVQVNTVAATFAANHGVPTYSTMLFFLLLLAPVILGGIRSVARASEYLAPIMAGAYVVITLVVLVLHPGQALAALTSIFTAAFGPTQVAGGVTGGLFVALVNGARRGLFSNEAGLGTTPNAAGAAAVDHPVQQGFLQAFGVFVDTIVVCTATALLILVSGVYTPGMDPAAAGSLTAQAVTSSLGSWMALPMSLIIFIFGYTSAYGAYSYGQVALDSLTSNRAASWGFRVLAVAVAGLGAVVKLPVVWALSDFLLGLGGIINLVAIVVLVRWVRVALEDWEKQTQLGTRPVFNAGKYPRLRPILENRVWSEGSDRKVQ
ncbi:alanine/glycine:cation symporter family protein [Gleimia hominis]|uniref:alanine/glycine:cation symporter family protein n=1 Tax=Gleimia hominis TaxID=595468 RepID=UPI000C810488|nr:alanine/glycine:cation symporter family protein [Gleimia hominis]WIK65350.1 alanine/glycine:cation symporter family protein [Gleimia hominis]